MPQKEKLTVTISKANKKTIQTKAAEITKITHDKINLSLGLRAILDDYEATHTN